MADLSTEKRQPDGPRLGLYSSTGLNLNIAIVGAIVVVFPLAILLSFFPFWETVGRFPPVRFVNSWLAPSIDAMPDSYRDSRAPNFPLKRFLIGCTTLTWIAFLSNFAVLLSRSYRDHALLVWERYGRTRLLVIFLISGAGFATLWYLFFANWILLAFLVDWADRLVNMTIVAFPLITFHFGHVTAIVVLGSLKSVAQWFAPQARPR